jgi:hypothetical protein
MFGKKKGKKPVKVIEPEEDQFPEDDETPVDESDAIDDSDIDNYQDDEPEPVKKAPIKPNPGQRQQPSVAQPEMDPAIERTLKSYNETFGRLTTPHMTDTLLIACLHELRENNRLLRELVKMNK